MREIDEIQTKSKNIPGEIIGDFYQKPAKFENFVLFCLQKSLVIFGKKSTNSEKKVCFFVAEIIRDLYQKPSKISKNHQNMTSQNRYQFGHRTLSSCFRAGFRFDMVKPVKNRQKSSKYDFSKPVSVWP